MTRRGRRLVTFQWSYIWVLCCLVLGVIGVTASVYGLPNHCCQGVANSPLCSGCYLAKTIPSNRYVHIGDTTIYKCQETTAPVSCSTTWIKCFDQRNVDFYTDPQCTHKISVGDFELTIQQCNTTLCGGT